MPTLVLAQASAANNPNPNTFAPANASKAAATQPESTIKRTPQIPDDGSKRYLVELIILQNENGTDTNTEIWDRFNVSETVLRDSAFESPYATGPATGQPGTREEFREATGAQLHRPDLASGKPLPPDVIPTELVHLAAPLRLLQLGNQYHVLKHAAWIQTLTGKREAATVQLSQLPTFSQVTGTVRIYENRLLFIEVDFAFRGAVSSHSPDARTTGTVVPRYGSDPRTMTFRLNEKRRVKLNELHYLDHPYYGVLIRISRWGEETDSKKTP